MKRSYRVEVWRNALNRAEADVMQATATPVGGRKPDEDLISYVARCKKLQHEAVERWAIAQNELEVALAELKAMGD